MRPPAPFGLLVPVLLSFVTCTGLAGPSMSHPVRTAALASPDGDWERLLPTGSRHGHSEIYDPVRDRMVVFGGWDGAYLNDVWALTWGPPLAVPGLDAPLPARFELDPPRPTPSRGAVTFDFAVSRAARISIVVHDVTGRAIARVADGVFQPGRHSVVWSVWDRGGSAVPAGLYFVRFDGPGVLLTRKVALIR